ncbi:hypothetical protein ACFE04_023823 [Oxalis oulophora]
MAMQSGIGLSKIFLIAGAGYTGSILMKNGKLSDIIGELQSIIKNLESGEKSEGDSEYADAVAAQVRRLAMEVRQLASARQITVLNGGSGGNVVNMLVPAATLGAVGYGYMWWKGISFSDLMYVTRKNMENAVSNMTKHLEGVSNALTKAKEHITQRIEGLDDKIELQTQLTRDIRDQVALANNNFSQIELEFNSLQLMVNSLDGKVDRLEDKQDMANLGVMYLCNFVNDNRTKYPEALKGGINKLKLTGRTRALLIQPELQGLKGIGEALGGKNGFALENVDNPPRALMRASSAV